MGSWLRAGAFFLVTDAVWVLVLVPFLAWNETDSAIPELRAPALAGIGIGLALLGAVLALLAIHALLTRGDGTPLAFAPPRRLVTTGPYARVRNPEGVGLLALTVGAAVAVDGTQVWLLPLVAAAYVFVALTPGEVRALRERFGEEYEAYHAAVPAWIPRLRTAPR